MTKPAGPAIDVQKARQDALSAWWSADYSVEGLKTKQVPGAGAPKLLYEYWFDGEHAPRVVEFAGRSWTIFHLPMSDLAGNKSEKATWDAEQIEAFYTEISRREGEGLGRYRAAAALREDLRPRASFDGVVFPFRGQPVTISEAYPSYTDAIFLGAIDLGMAATPANFRNAVFHSDVVARRFDLGADFDGATFLGHAWFSNASFGGAAEFSHVRFYGQADFGGSSFAGAPDFRDSVFSGRARFDDGVAYGIFLDSAVFFEKGSFRRREFHGPVSLRAAVFRDACDFSDCKFDQPLYVRAEFHGSADFSSKNGGQFGAEVVFNATQFLSDVDFSGREFSRSTRFVACDFARAPQFFGASPHSSTSFSGSRFKATIGDLPRFDDMFGKVVDSRSREGDIEEIFHVPLPFGLQPLTLNRIFRWVPFAEWLPVFFYVRTAREESTKKLEDSYRTARHLFEADGELAGQFYALEMDTRRNRRDVSIVERWLLYLFALSSGYGRYLGRALFTLIGALLFVTALGWFALPNLELAHAPSSAGEVFAQVWRMFLLPAAFSPAVDPAKADWMADLVKAYPVAYVLVSGLCALTTAGVVGVALVTFRRRFALK